MRYSTFFQVKRLKIVKTLPVNKMFPSPAHDTIFLIFEAGKNLAEKILALWLVWTSTKIFLEWGSVMISLEVEMKQKASLIHN